MRPFQYAELATAPSMSGVMYKLERAKRALNNGLWWIVDI